MSNEDRDSVGKALQASPGRQLDQLLGRRPSAEEASAMRRAEALGIGIDMIGGNAPVQAEGFFDDKAFYFRARHDFWLFEIGPKDTPYAGGDWEIERDYGGGEDASWMPIHVALDFICASVEEFRAASAPHEPGRRRRASPRRDGELPRPARAPKNRRPQRGVKR